MRIGEDEILAGMTISQVGIAQCNDFEGLWQTPRI
jgi:hypothetical protein